jgi:hypothetical protein
LDIAKELALGGTAMAIVTVYAPPMVAKLADVSGWVTVVAAFATLILGTFLGAFANVADRWHGRRARRGDLAAVGIRHGQWFRGQMPIPLTQVGPGTFVDSTDGVGFPMTVVNGSGEKITNVEFGIRWRTGGELAAGFAGVLLLDEKEEGTAWGEVDDDTFEPHDFHDAWLDRLDFFVRFTDQRGDRHENVLRHRPEPSWTSSRVR